MLTLHIGGGKKMLKNAVFAATEASKKVIYKTFIIRCNSINQFK